MQSFVTVEEFDTDKTYLVNLANVTHVDLYPLSSVYLVGGFKIELTKDSHKQLVNTIKDR